MPGLTRRPAASRLPHELIWEIIAALWHQDLPPSQRVHLMKTMPLVNRSWLRVFRDISSKDVYIPTPSYASYLIELLGTGRRTAFDNVLTKPDGRSRVVVPFDILCHSLALTLHFTNPTLPPHDATLGDNSRSPTAPRREIGREAVADTVANAKRHTPDFRQRTRHHHHPPNDQENLNRLADNRAVTTRVLTNILFHLRVTGALPNLHTIKVTYENASVDDMYSGYPFIDLPERIRHLELRYVFPSQADLNSSRQFETPPAPGVDVMEQATVTEKGHKRSLPFVRTFCPQQRADSMLYLGETGVEGVPGYMDRGGWRDDELPRKRTSYPPWQTPFVQKLTFVGGTQELLVDILEGAQSVGVVETDVCIPPDGLLIV